MLRPPSPKLISSADRRKCCSSSPSACPASATDWSGRSAWGCDNRRDGHHDTAIIQCDQVEKWFGDFQALKGITTSVAEGEVVVILGPSGSGKSTFILTINRLEERDASYIIVDGVELNDDLRNLERIRSEVGAMWRSARRRSATCLDPKRRR